MRYFLISIMAAILISCDHTDTNMPNFRSQYFIYNKSSHNIEITEMAYSSNSLVNIYDIPVNDSVIITTGYNDDIVSPFGTGDIFVVFDDSVKYNCTTHIYKLCSNSNSFKHKFSNESIIAMEYIITDEDYNMVVSILNEEQ